MTKNKVIVGAIICAILGGIAVWAYMTFTFVSRAELEQLRDASEQHGRELVGKSAALDSATDAQAEVERLKADEQR